MASTNLGDDSFIYVPAAQQNTLDEMFDRIKSEGSRPSADPPGDIAETLIQVKNSIDPNVQMRQLVAAIQEELGGKDQHT